MMMLKDTFKCHGVIRLAALLICLFMLAACGSKTVDLPDNALGLSEEREQMYREALADSGTPLTETEMQALLSEGELDRNLSPEELCAVQTEFRRFVHRSRQIIEIFLLRSQSYMAYTRNVFRERGMPEDLACLAFVESGFNPVAVSRSNAVGMWQFMAPTGRQYGLKQDWWMDERRDPYRATHAAADYLSKLYRDFGHWHLALAAYNAGEGRIGRALAGTGSKTFFELCEKNCLLEEKRQIRKETQDYVPRFLAICKIMRNADKLGFKAADPKTCERAADIPILAPVVGLSARPGTDLAALAKGLGMSWKEFANYNPAFHRYITPPDRSTTIYVPQHAESMAISLLRDKRISGHGWSTYVVAKGDTMTRISRRTGVPVRVLRQFNPKSEPLKAGAKIRIPGRAGSTLLAEADDEVKKPEKPAKKQTAKEQKKRNRQSVATHTVRKGETMSSVARTYGVSLADMRKANAGLNPDSLKAGQKIKLPQSARIQTAKAKTTTYKVRPGDTMWGIARKFNMPPDDLLSLNRMNRATVLKPGDKVRVTVN